MTIYAVFARDANEVPRVVPERFSWLAFLLPPVFAVWEQLWLELVAWLVLVMLLGAGVPVIGGTAVFCIYGLLMLWIGFEAPALRAAALRRAGFTHLTDLVAAGPDLAAVAALAGRGAS
jgi:hypothetical protein